MRGDLSYPGRFKAEFLAQRAEEVFDGEIASDFQGHDGGAFLVPNRTGDRVWMGATGQPRNFSSLKLIVIKRQWQREFSCLYRTPTPPLAGNDPVHSVKRLAYTFALRVPHGLTHAQDH